MVTAERLLRLYPRGWRDRYGDEFLEMVGPERLQLQQTIDIVFGAIDAWLSAEVRGAAQVQAQGGPAMVKTISVCSHNQLRYTRRDSLIGAAIMLIVTATLTGLGIAAQRTGWTAAGETLVNLGYLVAMVISMPFWLTKGQPWKAQAALLVTIVTILIIVSMMKG
jgi:hypothetical protein